MQSLSLRQVSLVLLVFGFGVVTGLVADTTNDSPQRVETHRADLEGAPGMEVVVSTGEYPPGSELSRHFHHGIEAAYVVQGGTVQAPGREPMPLPTGTALFNLREVPHGGFTIVGDAPLKVFTVHIVDKGKPLYDVSVE